jgi:hypothetical protein
MLRMQDDRETAKLIAEELSARWFHPPGNTPANVSLPGATQGSR